MNIVFMGTPDFSVPMLEKLNSDNDINMSYVVTKADTKANRGQKLNFSAVKQKAIELGLNILQPEKIKNDVEVIRKIKESNPDFIVVVAYGQILSKEILDIPKYGCINAHASLLPKYRGASPIQSAIFNGDKKTGVTTMLMDIGLDDGDILEQEIVDIDDKETSDSLFDKLSIVAADTMIHTLKNFNSIERKKQNDGDATKSVIIKKEFGKIDFSIENKVDIDRKVRAYTSWPSAYIECDGIQYKIWDVSVDDYAIDINNAKEILPYVYLYKNEIFAKCNDGFLKINELQKSGKKRMNSKDFINGLKKED